MRNKTDEKPKLTVRVESLRGTTALQTVDIYDNRTDSERKEYIRERGIERFADLNDLKETLNWNLNGDSAKYLFQWAMTGKERSTGLAYIFD